MNDLVTRLCPLSAIDCLCCTDQTAVPLPWEKVRVPRVELGSDGYKPPALTVELYPLKTECAGPHQPSSPDAVAPRREFRRAFPRHVVMRNLLEAIFSRPLNYTTSNRLLSICFMFTWLFLSRSETIIPHLSPPCQPRTFVWCLLLPVVWSSESTPTGSTTDRKGGTSFEIPPSGSASLNGNLLRCRFLFFGLWLFYRACLHINRCRSRGISYHSL